MIAGRATRSSANHGRRVRKSKEKPTTTLMAVSDPLRKVASMVSSSARSVLEAQSFSSSAIFRLSHPSESAFARSKLQGCRRGLDAASDAPCRMFRRSLIYRRRRRTPSGNTAHARYEHRQRAGVLRRCSALLSWDRLEVANPIWPVISRNSMACLFSIWIKPFSNPDGSGHRLITSGQRWSALPGCPLGSSTATTSTPCTRASPLLISSFTSMYNPGFGVASAAAYVCQLRPRSGGRRIRLYRTS